MPHYLVKRIYEDRNRPPQLEDEFPLSVSSHAQAISEAKLLGPMTTPPPAYCELYWVSNTEREKLWDSRQDVTHA